MKYLLISTILLTTSSLAFASKEDSIKNILIYDDFNTWINEGEALLNWKDILQITPKKSVTTNKIKNDFSGNEVAANRDYLNQWVRIKGTVKNVKLEKDGKMYADLTENYTNFKAYIFDSKFAASLQPNQKVDMYCFNATANSATQCIDYPQSVWAKVSKKSLLDVDNVDINKEISLISLLIADNISDEDFLQYCSSNIKSTNCKNLVLNLSNDLEKTLEKTFKKHCGKSKESESCKVFKGKVKNLELK